MVVTVVAKLNALPCHTTLSPTVIPASLITVPINIEFAPSVVAEVGVQKTSQADAHQDSETTELATVLNAPLILKIYVQFPCNIIPDDPIEAAAVIQYTPGVNGCGRRLKSVAVVKVKSHDCAFKAANARP